MLKKCMLVIGVCSILILPLFLSSYSINVQEEYYYEVSTGDVDYEPRDTEEDWEIF